MPLLTILTNLPKNKIPADFINKIIPMLAKVLQKEEKGFTVVISTDCQLSMAGDVTQPGVVARLQSIGNVGPDENKYTASEMAQFIHKELGVHRDRFSLTFFDICPAMISKRGGVLAAKL